MRVSVPAAASMTVVNVSPKSFLLFLHLLVFSSVLTFLCFFS